MNTKILLVTITIISFLLRFYRADNYPSLLWDEAALGYNAYSILITGKDEFGQILPLNLQSFGDYKPAFYSYLALPFIAVFGLNQLSTRLPSIILGSLTPMLLYLFISQLSPKSKRIGIFSALILATNPLNIHFSRGAWETNILTFELLLASLFFIKQKYFLSSLTFAATLYTYQGAKLISLLLIISLFIVHYKLAITKAFQIMYKFVIPLGLLSLPLIFSLGSSVTNRLKVVSLLSYPRSTEETQLIKSESSTTDYNLFYHHPQFFTRNFLSRYFNHFSPEFLAFNGDWQNSRHSAPYIGQLLYPTFLFFFFGLFLLLAHPADRKQHSYMFLWLVFAPIPGALTRDSVTAVRVMSLSIPLVFFSAYGINFFTNKLIGIHRILFMATLLSIYALSFAYYSELYHHHTVKQNPTEYLYGYSQAVQYVKNNQSDQPIVFTDFYGQPYIFYLFYSQYPPSSYQAINRYQSNGFDTGKVEYLDNLHFTSPNFQNIKNNPGTLGIFSHDEILRQGIINLPEFTEFIPLSPINNTSTFYAYQSK